MLTSTAFHLLSLLPHLDWHYGALQFVRRSKDDENNGEIEKTKSLYAPETPMTRRARLLGAARRSQATPPSYGQQLTPPSPEFEPMILRTAPTPPGQTRAMTPNTPPQPLTNGFVTKFSLPRSAIKESTNTAPSTVSSSSSLVVPLSTLVIPTDHVVPLFTPPGTDGESPAATATVVPFMTTPETKRQLHPSKDEKTRHPPPHGAVLTHGPSLMQLQLEPSLSQDGELTTDNDREYTSFAVKCEGTFIIQDDNTNHFAAHLRSHW
jgi:hypothetical protein